MISVSVLNNITLLVSLSIVYSWLVRRWRQGTLTHQLLSGLLFGAVAVAGMMNSLPIIPGIILDGRSIILSVAGLFGGPITAAIAILVSSAFRLHIGGAGTLAGIGIIVESASLGVACYYLRRRNPAIVGSIYLWGLGMLVHIGMLLLWNSLGPISTSLFLEIAIPVIIVYPVVMVFLCKLLLDQEYRFTAEERFRQIAQSAGEWIWEVDKNGMFTYASPIVEKMLGYAPAELVGRKYFYDLFVPEERESLKKAAFDVFARRESFDRFVNANEHRNGRRVFLETVGIPILDATGDLLGYRGIDADVTRRHEAEAERSVLISELEAKNTELERFAYTVSHDLKSPLVTIRGFVNYLEQDALTGNIAQLKDDVARVTAAVDKMAQLLNELLELSRIGRMINPPEEVPFDALAREAANNVITPLARRNVKVIVHAGLPVLYGDPLRLREVVENLVTNAIKYMGDQPEPRIEIGARRDGSEVVCYVRDNGIGIAPAYHRKVFELFAKLDSRTEGTGVGLAVVKRVVEVHGGRVWVESEGSGKGSTFCFTLSGNHTFDSEEGGSHGR